MKIFTKHPSILHVSSAVGMHVPDARNPRPNSPFWDLGKSCSWEGGTLNALFVFSRPHTQYKHMYECNVCRSSTLCSSANAFVPRRGRAAVRRRRRTRRRPPRQSKHGLRNGGGGSQRRIHFSCEVGGPFPSSPPQSFYFFSPSLSSFFLFFLFHVRWQFPLPFFPVFLSCVYSVSAISDEKSVLIKSKIEYSRNH